MDEHADMNETLDEMMTLLRVIDDKLTHLTLSQMPVFRVDPAGEDMSDVAAVVGEILGDNTQTATEILNAASLSEVEDALDAYDFPISRQTLDVLRTLRRSKKETDPS